MSQREILEKLNEIGGQHGIGIIDIVENRVVGMKSRGVYETPGGTILMEAHQQLEELILDRETLKYKRLVSVIICLSLLICHVICHIPPHYLPYKHKCCISFQSSIDQIKRVRKTVP